jgi:hypothetical protein
LKVLVFKVWANFSISICLLVIVSTGTCTSKLLFSSNSSVLDLSSPELADDVLFPLF